MKSEFIELRERLSFWEREAKRSAQEAIYYRDELKKSHTILGRVIHQLSERWDSVNLTEYYPTDNLHHFRSINNPDGLNPLKKEKGK